MTGEVYSTGNKFLDVTNEEFTDPEVSHGPRVLLPQR